MLKNRSKQILRNKYNNSILLLVMLCIFSSCKILEVDSHFRDRDIVIDGRNTEWKESLTSLDDNGTMVGLMNDEQFLYLSFMTTNRDLHRRIMRQGLTLWFDKDDRENKLFGIHFPVRSESPDQMQQEIQYGQQQETNYRTDISDNITKELEICGPGEGETHRMTIAEATGIEVKIHSEPDNLFYEIKVPLYDNERFPFAIGTKLSNQISVGIEVTNHLKPMEKALTGMNDNEQNPSQGMGRQSGEYGRGRGSRGDGGQNHLSSGSQSDPYKVWLKVKLKTKEQ